MKKLFSLLLLFAPFIGFTQTTEEKALFTMDEFLLLVKENHPIAQQANLQPQKGDSQIRKARGNFDPKLEAAFQNKYYSGKEYYNLTSATIKVPTIAAAELKGGFDLNSGNYLNPEDITPNDGLLTAGISIPLIQGLITDERRSTLRIAQAFKEYSLMEQKIILNDLIYKANNAYLEWWAAHEKVTIALDMERVATERFGAVRSRALAGQAPIIDTVEAHIQMQLRRQLVQEARGNEIKTRMTLSTYVWEGDKENKPRVLSSNNLPMLSSNISFQNYQNSMGIGRLDSIEYYNPYLRQFDAKFQSLRQEEKWKKEKIKPKLNINYNLLSYSPSDDSGIANDFSTRNYKWGIDFSFPILARESRGDLQLQRIKIQETTLDFTQKKQEVRTKAMSSMENTQLLEQQIALTQSNITSYKTLLEGERTRFFLGESSLFLVNQRELQYVDASNKLIDLELKKRLLQAELMFLTGGNL